MKKIITIILAFFIITTNINAEEISITKQIQNKKENNINIKNSFIYFSKFFEGNTPETYKYIFLNFYGINGDLELEKALKILVYNNKLENLKVNIGELKEKNINRINFYKLSKKILGIDFNENTIKINNKIDFSDLELIEESFEIIKNKEIYKKKIEQNFGTNNIFSEVYDTLINEHFDKENFDKNKLLYSAINGLTKSTEDKYTVFFPPTESKDFLGGLSGDFEGIGAFVEMPSPGVFKITSPILGGPAEKAGIKGGDIVLEVDGKEIKEENSQNEIISWIKGKAGTEVNLKIQRGNEILKIKVTREKVHLKSVETETSGNNFIIKITGFNEDVTSEFIDAINELKEKKFIKKIIVDLRNNGGGYLNEVVAILDLIIPKGEATANVKYINTEGKYISKGLKLLDINDYEFIFLQNGATASASEIMIGTIKDYFPNIKIIGEKTYGKGSVQTIKEFSDGSSFKYTTAKWFTGKTKTGIDGIGINPDIEIKFDSEKFKNFKIDNQLERALNI